MACEAAADVDGDDRVDIADAIEILNVLFSGGGRALSGDVWCTGEG